MDLKSLIAKATTKSDIVEPVIGLHAEIGGRAPQPIPQEGPSQDNPICGACPHPYDAHEEGQECNILECDCIGFIHKVPSGPKEIPDKPAPTLNLTNASIPAKATQPTVVKCPNCDESPCPTPEACAQDIAEANAKKSGKMTFKVPAGLAAQIKAASSDVEETPPQPVDLEQDAIISDLTKCKHLCENPQCKKWWSHGDKDKCRYPDLISQGLCLTCLNGNLNEDPTADFQDGKFTVAAEVKIRNRERTQVCKDMNVEQLTRHIALLAKEIEKLRIQSLETRKMRAEAEEAELENVPEEDREKFIQALRNGQKKGERKPRASKKVKDEESPDPSVRLSAYDKTVINLMRRTGKTREEVEKYIND